MVIAFIALLVAGGGAAVAAIPDSDDGEIHGCYNNRNGDLRVIDAEAGENCGSRETALTWNQQGPPGTPGSAGASALTGRVNLVDIPGSLAGTQRFADPSGTSSPNENLSSVEHLSPNATIVGRDLAVKAFVDPAGGFLHASFSLVDDGVVTPLSCEIQQQFTGDGVCNSSGMSTSISPGSELGLRIVVTGPTGTSIGNVRFGWRATTP
jgi:hypothetical protein